MKLNHIKALSFLLIASIILMYSCSSSDDNNTSPTTVAQDKQNISNTINGFYTCLETLDDGDLSNFLLYTFFNNGNSEYNDSYIKSLVDEFEFQYGNIVVNDKFQFANMAGIYTWNSTTSNWTKTTNSSSIILKFPSTSSSISNDSELSLDSYNDTLTSYTSETIWLPTSVNLILKRNNNTLFSLHLSNVTFDVSTNFSMPTNFDLVVFTAPFTNSIHWDKISNTDFKLSFSSSTPQGCTTTSITNFKLQDADYGNITSIAEDLKSINGSFSEGNLKVVYSINVEAISAINDPTPVQINANSDAEVFYNDLKIGDLNYVETNGQTEIFIVYSDGTTENVEAYVSDFKTQIETIFENYLN